MTLSAEFVAPDTTADARRRRVRPLAGRRLPHPGPAARRVDLPRARARGGCRAREHRPRPPRARALAAAVRGHRIRPHRGRPRLLARRARVPVGAPLRAAERRLRPHDRAAVRRRALPVRPVRAAPRIRRPRARRRSPARPSRRSTTTATTPTSGCCRLGARHRRVPPPPHRGARRPLAARRRAVRGRAAERPRWRTSRRARPPCAPAFDADVAPGARRDRARAADDLLVVRRRPARPPLRVPRHRCSPRCRCWHGSIPGATW